MNIRENEILKSIKLRLADGMISFMADGDVGYTKRDVEVCIQILDDFTDSISICGDRNAAMESVKATVLKLNDLNERAGEDLIETDQREDICEYIIKAGALLGFNTEDEDVTEEWREW